MVSSKPALVVGAIDIGTTYTEWAYLTKSDFEQNPCAAFGRSVHGHSRISHQAPTCVLITPDGKTVKGYGNDAESIYNEMRAKNEHEQWYFYRRFKKLLWIKSLHKYTMLKDETGKSLPALSVISLSIRYLKSDLLHCSRNAFDDDIHWVITVPAAWHYSAKQFMRLAALQAGILEESLTIATEPEAAWNYCTYSLAKRSGELGFSKPEKRFMILDAGGSRMQMTVYEVLNRSKIRETAKEVNENCGAITVDSAFIDFLKDLFGKPSLDRLKEEFPEYYNYILDNWEIKKRSVEQRTCNIRIPLLKIAKEDTGQELKDIIPSSRYKGLVSIKNNLLRIAASIVREFHQKTIDAILKDLSRLLQQNTYKGLETILLVGGYNESSLLREAIEEKFPILKIVAPEHPGIAVLTGAVILGHCPVDIAVIKRGFLLTAAIDFGTTYSGWAYSFVHEFETDPTHAKCPVRTGNNLVSQKAPTSVLIKPDGQYIDTFGFEAETRYSELSETGNHKNWYFFQRFKMILYNKPIHKDTMLEDETGKRLPALKVFALSIRFMMDCLLDTCQQRVTELDPDEIHWVLTVPAIWNDQAKHFMRLAAQEAEMSPEQLTLAFEPEAASIFCRHLKVQTHSDCSISSFQSGKKYLVLDVGGGTIDITVHEVCFGGGLKELYKATGGAWGGTMVDQAFLDFIADLIGKDVLNSFKDTYMEDYIGLMRDFELKKRKLDSRSDGHVTIGIPSIISVIVKEMKGTDLQQLIKTNPHAKQETIRMEFPRMKVIIPTDAGLSVLKGAVIFGHSPTFIKERISKYTYGTNASGRFDDSKHPLEKRTLIGGVYRCVDIFVVLV
ncbi:heat shock 70 kDa protein 12A-like isoform X4 [Dreissena polymorpha]|uniref:heat shock 70 kDa protein 12A-like isoform X4 n=1 Tax=Dreissena polymorpha TaxID=45954 RepID=UPI0022644AFA|nr:heat shock 70 kDa protein 12A-like isoform X4 [Dreissena polymorpha]